MFAFERPYLFCRSRTALALTQETRAESERLCFEGLLLGFDVPTNVAYFSQQIKLDDHQN